MTVCGWGGESVEREGGKGMARGLTKGNTHTMVALPVMEHQRYVAGSLGRWTER